MKEIIPNKIIINLNEDGTFRDGIMQYRIKADGVLKNKYFTMGIKDGINLDNLGITLNEAHAHVSVGEGIITKEEAISILAAKKEVLNEKVV